jgi:hypothetical protein
MTSSIVTQAFNLFVETLPLDTLDVNNPWQSAQWHDLYSKECQLFDLMRQFTPEEMMEYKRLLMRREMYMDTDPGLVDWTMQTR